MYVNEVDDCLFHIPRCSELSVNIWSGVIKRRGNEKNITASITLKTYLPKRKVKYDEFYTYIRPLREYIRFEYPSRGRRKVVTAYVENAISWSTKKLKRESTAGVEIVPALHEILF